MTYSQDRIPGITKPEDVVFEDPFEKFNLTASFANPRSKILLQDSKGFIWLIDKRTLYKYDGYELKDFLKVPVGPHTMTGSSLATMVEDEFGYIWLGCHGRQGVYRYDPRKEIFQRFPREGKNDPKDISESEIWTICPDNHGRVWIGTTGYGPGRGLYMYDYETDSVREFRHEPDNPESLPSDDILTIFVDKHENIWISLRNLDHRFGGALYQFNPEQERFTEFLLSAHDKSTWPLFTRQIKCDILGNLYLNLKREILADTVYPYLVKISDNLKTFEFDSSDTFGLFKNYQIYPEVTDGLNFDIDNNGVLWIQSSPSGIIRFDPETRQLSEYKPYSFVPGTYYFLSNVLCDASGSVWFSYVHGLKQYIPAKRKFTSYDSSFFQLAGIPGGVVYSIYEDPDGVLWMGVDSSLIKYDPGTRLFNKYDPIPELKTMDNRLEAILQGEDDELYIAARNCVYIFNIETETFESIPYPISYANYTGSIESFNMLKDSSGKLWIGTDPGCIQVDLQKKNAVFLVQDSSTAVFLGGTAEGISQDINGYIWLGSEFGLTRFNPKDSTSIKFIHGPFHPEGIAAPYIKSVLADRKGNIWIGHLFAGLSKIDARDIKEAMVDPDSIKFKHYSRANGLPDLRIESLAEDLSGNIWIATHKGLAMLNTATEKITVYDSNDGLQVGFFESKFFVKPSSGRIYIGGKNGMLSFIPETMPMNKYIPPVVLTGFRLHNQAVSISDTSVLKNSITYTDQLDLSYKENFLLFEFAALDYTSPEKNQYKYFMDGVDQDTVFSGTLRTAEYRNLAPGKYTFWVTGSNSDGLWNPSGTSIDINIHPPWYRSAAAQSGYILMMLTIVFAFVRIRTERLRKEKISLEKKVESRTAELQKKNEQIIEMERLKTQFFTDVSHEIRTPLSLISGPLDKLMESDSREEKDKTWLSMIKRNSKRLLQLVNQLLDISRLDAGGMKLIIEEADVFKHFRILSSEYLSLAESKGIKFVIDVPNNGYHTYYDKEKLDKITTNLLSNAFKFTPENGIVTIRIRILNNPGPVPATRLRIIVADNGPGIPKDEHEKVFDRFYRAEGEIHEDAGGTGIGLSLTKDLIQLMKGEIVLKSAIDSGSIFFITIPLGIGHLEENEYILKDGERETEIPGKDTEVLSTALLNSEEADAATEILIIEDNKDLRDFIHESLSAKYKISLAENGQIGLDKAKSMIPDLIITDVMMPEMDGMEFCRRVKSDELTSHIPIIMLTAKSTIEDKMEGLKLGADAYMFKPFLTEELIVQINNLIEQRDRLRKKYSNMIGLDWGEMTVTTIDEKFIKKVTAIISENLHKFEFDVTQLQEQMSMSRANLFRKVKALTGNPPSELIREMRLKTAASFIEKGEGNITSVALDTGFSNPSYFTKCFKEMFGKTPSEYKKGFQ